MRYFLEIAYNGSTFHGWQIQPNAQSVQETIEKAISIVTNKNVSITGAGRTDTGVHARCMYAHFDSDQRVIDKSKWLLSVNSLTGKNILIKNIIEVSDDAHARFDATKRTYKYFVTFKRNPFNYPFCWFSPSGLDMEKMNIASNYLLNNRDFTSFAKLHSDNKTNICEVNKAVWLPLDQDKEALDFMGNLNEGIVFTISADRFLRNMVRAIVGTLVEVGKGKLSIEGFRNIIEEKNRSCAGTSMPAHALFLWDISYPFLSDVR